MRIRIGLDFGTSNVVVAYPQGDQVNVHSWGLLGDGHLLPSYVQLTARGTSIGAPARQAWERGDSNAYRRFKLRLGRALESAEGPTAQELTTHLIRELVRNLIASPTYVSDILAIESAVVTVPHAWTPTQREATRVAVEAAGLSVSRLLDEPVAAAVHFARLRQLPTSETLLICDMGAGTFDVTQVQVEGMKMTVWPRGTVANRFAGGYADACIARRILARITGAPRNLEDFLGESVDPLLRPLLHEVERARLNLNFAAAIARTQGEPLSDLSPHLVPIRVEQGASQSYPLRFEEMVDWMEDLTRETQELLATLLADAVGPRPTGVVLAGGMSRMLPVQDAIAVATGLAVDRLQLFRGDADCAIAQGAAVVARGDVTVEQALPWGIGLVSNPYGDARQEQNQIVIPAGTPLPATRRSGALRLRRDTQVLELTVTVGNSERLAECVLVGHPVTLTASTRALTPIEFEFALTVDRQLAITAICGNRREPSVVVPLHEAWTMGLPGGAALTSERR